jgi:hypothetical protein
MWEHFIQGGINVKIKKSDLILTTFDGTMRKLNIKPKCVESTIEFQIEYYNSEDTRTGATLVFEQVIAIDFQINYFNNSIGSELMGFYEIYDNDRKIQMIEKIFNNRLEGYLYHGDYNYDKNDENDILNSRSAINRIVSEIEKYHLYQQQTEGGIFYILANGYKLTSN